MSKSPDIDRGWAYVVLAGHFFARFLVTGISMSPGIMYNEMLNYFENSPTLTAWAVNLNTFSLYTSGSISCAFIKAYGFRVTMIIGCIISSVGLLATSFATSLVHILVFYGMVTGFGFSMVNVSCYPVVTSYFVKHRFSALLLASSGESIGQFAIPYLFLWLSNAYSWKGALIVIAGLNLNFLAVAAVFMPPRMESEAIKCDDTPQVSNKVRCTTRTNHRWKASRVVSFLKTSFVNDLTLFRDHSFVLVFFSYLFSASGAIGMMTNVKTYGLRSGLTDFEATTLLSFLGLFSLTGTVTITLLLRMSRVNVLLLNIIFKSGTGVAIVILGVVRTKTGFFIIAAIIGFFLGSIASFPLVILTVVGARNIAAGIALASVSVAVSSVAGGLIGAALYTADPTFIACFVTLGVFCILGALLLIPVMFAKRDLEE